MRYFVCKSLDEDQKETYSKWKELVNMTSSELEEFMNSEEGKVAGLTREQAKNAGSNGERISTGRDSARAILRMKKKSVLKWNANDWEWAKKQISFISRMTGMNGELRDSNGKPTRKLLSLLIWGNDPEKSKH